MIFAFAPFMPQNSGDEYVGVITKTSGGVPVFGTLAVDDTESFEYCYMLSCGESYTDRMSMILVYGDIAPKFFIANISDDKILDKSAVVTKSSGHVLMEVNDRPISVFFEDLGLTKASETQYALTSIQFMVDYNDGSPKVAKVFISLTPERHALCAGTIPEGSTLYVANTDTDDVLLTTEKAIDGVLESIEGASCLLIYSCISRALTLGAEPFKEMKLIDDKIAGGLPFMMAYSGGEICPTKISENKASNRVHNGTFIACLF
jgi:hypothetical protein